LYDPEPPPPPKNIVDPVQLLEIPGPPSNLFVVEVFGVLFAAAPPAPPPPAALVLSAGLD
jgi:hypothetical protein